MYANKLVVAVKSDGRTLREFNDQVLLPFNSEYSLLIKNKNSVRASVKVEIDGTDVTEGVSLVVDPNDEIELERFIKNGNLDRGNRFRFIERTQAVVDHRGAKAEDGLVRVEFQYEKLVYVRPVQPMFTKGFENPWGGSINRCSDTVTGGNSGNLNYMSMNSNRSYASCSSEVGITAPGSISTQEFQTVSNFHLEPQRHVIILRLIGERAGKVVTNSVTTRARTSCVTCGHRSRTNAKFCSQCGTSLQIID